MIEPSTKVGVTIGGGKNIALIIETLSVLDNTEVNLSFYIMATIEAAIEEEVVLNPPTSSRD